MKKKKVIILVVFVVIVGFLLYRYVQLRPNENDNVIRVSGNMEVTDVEVSFKIPGRVEEKFVSEGDTIKKGQMIAQLDKTELVQEVALRKAGVDAAQASLSKMEAGYRPEEIAQVHAEVYRLMIDAERLQVDNERQKQLYENKIISSREGELSKATYEMALAKLHEAEEKLALLKKGYRREDIEEARAYLKKAKVVLSQAETRLGYTTLSSPISGVVLSENVEAGEYIVPGTPIVVVGELEKAWLRAYINETDLGRVKIGQRVHVVTDTYPNKVYEGKISFIASQAEFTPKNIQTEKERTKLVYRIKIDVPNPQMELKPGMPADADIFLDEDTK